MRRHTHQMTKPTLPDKRSRLPCLYALYALRNSPAFRSIGWMGSTVFDARFICWIKKPRRMGHPSYPTRPIAGRTSGLVSWYVESRAQGPLKAWMTSCSLVAPPELLSA
jgi:hypothetical protein